MSARPKAATELWLPLRVVKTTPDTCIAETSCRRFTVKFTYEPDEEPYVVNEVVGQACPRTSMVDIVRKQRRQEDIVLDKLKLIPEQP